MCGICPGSGPRYLGVRARDHLLDFVYWILALQRDKRGAIEKGHPAFARHFNKKRRCGTYRTKRGSQSHAATGRLDWLVGISCFFRDFFAALRVELYWFSFEGVLTCIQFFSCSLETWKSNDFSAMFFSSNGTDANFQACWLRNAVRERKKCTCTYGVWQFKIVSWRRWF